MDKYKAIRPYTDQEVPRVLTSLLRNKDLHSTFAKLRLAKLNRFFPWLAEHLIQRGLKKRFAQLNTVDDIQALMKKYAAEVIAQTTDGLSVSGMQYLDPKQQYLFISTHRDIVLDATFLSLVLLRDKQASMRIAIGDNLLKQEFVGDVMRLNKCFIVKRNISKPRQLLLSLLQLSGYIRYSITQDNHSVWIAQKEGRTKDGIDKTEAAIIKMLSISADKQQDFSEAIAELNIVPTAISYEYDPCDELKAKELYELEANGRYEKTDDEDVESIRLGIKGYKGRLHIAIAKPLNQCEGFSSLESAEKVAAAIDEKIIQHTILFPSNFFAYHILYGEYPKLACGEQRKPFVEDDYRKEKQFFERRVKHTAEQHRKKLLQAYANPIVVKVKAMQAEHHQS